MLISILSSCGVKNTNSSTDTKTNTETSTDSNTETETDTSSDTNTNTSTDTDVEVEQSEKQANQVYFSYEKKENNYYPEIINYTETDTPIEFPNEGGYFKIISTYEELLTYISVQHFDASVFKNNYVVCVKTNFFNKNFKIIGYYDFNYSDGKYRISYDCYKSLITLKESIDEPKLSHINYLVIPKAQIEFLEETQELETSQNEIKRETYCYVNNIKKSYTLPKNPTSWVVNTDSELQRKLGLNFDYIYNLENPYRVILYLPNEPECDFLITKKEIKNGDLYLTVEKYAQHTNEYLENNDVLFYDLYIEDTSLLSENYNVFISIENVFAPAAVEVENIDAGEAILIAQEHFYSTYYSDELPGTGYRARYVHFRDSYIIDVDGTEEVENLEPVWIVRICSNELADSDDIKYNEAYTYYISSTGKIIKTDEPW